MRFKKGKAFKSALVLAGILCGGFISSANAALVTDPDDSRNWQGATVGTFAALYFGSDTPENRQKVVDDQLLDDGVFNSGGYSGATLQSTTWTTYGGGCIGMSYDATGGYDCTSTNLFTAANSIDNLWFQTSGMIGETVFDLGTPSSKAAIFNSIDHGPLPQEAIESTVYLSNNLTDWTQAVTERVWLEGFKSDTGIKWDGFTYAVGTGTGSIFRYASIIHGGPGALISDGDNEINGVMGLKSDYTPTVPEPSTLILLGTGMIGLIGWRRKKIQK